MSTRPNNAKHSPNDSPIMYFPICSEMGLIGREMSEISDFDCRCAQEVIAKYSDMMRSHDQTNNIFELSLKNGSD
jgi:hypothetical protein